LCRLVWSGVKAKQPRSSGLYNAGPPGAARWSQKEIGF
jgi:hypothetical protein